MKKLILSIGMLICTFMMVSAQDQQTQAAPPNPNAPEIKFVSDTHDYGTMQKGADGNCTFEFTNIGKEPLIISNCRASCGCTVPNWPKDPILPGKGGKIDVHYDTNRLGQISKSITVTSNAKNSSVVLMIKGNVIEPPKEMTPDKPANNNVAPQTK
jgi:hypothetical protein